MASASNKAAGTSTGRSLWSKAMARILAMGLRMVSGRIVALSWAKSCLTVGALSALRWEFLAPVSAPPWELLATRVIPASLYLENACATSQ